jgi:hypothetical protein
MLMVFLLASSLFEWLIGPIRLAGHGDLIGLWHYLAVNTHGWRSRLGLEAHRRLPSCFGIGY